MNIHNSITIRQLDKGDTQEVQQLVLGIQREEFGVQIDIARQPELENLEYLGSKGRYWGAFAGEELVGTISIIIFAQDCAAIRKMFVKKQFRGAGLNVAALLLQDLTNFAVQNGITSLYLGTIELLQAAIRFYIKNGFVTVERSELPDSFPRMDSDNLFFKKTIKLAIP